MSTIISGSHKVAGSVLGTLLVKILSTGPDAGTLKTLLVMVSDFGNQQQQLTWDVRQVKQVISGGRGEVGLCK